MLEIDTFDNLRGGNTVYKALSHPLAAENLATLATTLTDSGPVAIYDPERIATPLCALAPSFPIEGIYVHDTLSVGETRHGHITRPLTDLATTQARTILIAAFDASRLTDRLTSIAPEGTTILTLDTIRLPDTMLTNRRRYLDPLNFATNFVFFRDDDHLATRLVTANYWKGYGASQTRLWCRLFAGSGETLLDFEHAIEGHPGTITLTSTDIRRAHNIGPFTGQLFLHAIGVAGHDVIKYALDTYSSSFSLPLAGRAGVGVETSEVGVETSDVGVETSEEGVETPNASLSCTHDANAWPSDRYAGLPAPRSDERVILWLQNSHAVPIPAGAISLDRMGTETPIPLATEIPPYATHALDIATLLPDLSWPAQIELRAGRHLVRPRYEITRNGRTRIAHVNVERADLNPDPGLKTLSPLLGRGFLLPFPILPRRDFSTVALPTPMAHSQATLPIRVEIFSPNGTRIAERSYGPLPRSHATAIDIDDILPQDALPEGGHAELLYDFSAGGDADGWLHGLFRYERRDGTHAAETSFGAHMFNTLMTWKSEPQSYAGPPPGLSTRLFLDLGTASRPSFCVLVYPASAPFHPASQTTLILHDAHGSPIASTPLAIACSGSALVEPWHIFAQPDLATAAGGYVIIRDTACRLFGYHGKRQGDALSFDHMFGF